MRRHSFENHSKDRLVIFIFFTLCFILYFKSLSVPFVFDDNHMIVRNNLIKDVRYIFEIFTSGQVTSVPIVKCMFRPILVLSLSFNYFFSKLNPLGYHIINILIHFLNSLLLFILLRNFLPKKYYLAAFLTTLLFICHPVNTEAVTYISCRSTLLATFFFLFSFLLYSKANLNRYDKNYYLSLVMFCFGLLTKEIMIVFPLIIFSSDIMLRKDRLKNFYIFVRPLLGFVLIAIAYLLLRQHLIGSVANVQFYRSVYSNFLTQFNVSIFYLKIFFLPVDLCIGRYFPTSHSFLEPRVIQSFLIFLAIWLFGLAAFRRNKLFTFAIIWYFVNLIPKFIASLALVASEHQLYLPAIGIFIAIGIGIERSIYFLQNKAKFLKLIAIAFFSILVIIMSVLTSRRIEVWQDEYNLWLNNIRYSPQAWGAYNNLGLVFLNEGKYEEALNHFNKALEGAKTLYSAPLLVDLYTNLSKLYILKGDFDSAEAELKKALEIDPRVAEAHNNLGLVYARKGMRSKEIAEFKLAIALDPSSIEAYNNLAISYWEEKKSDLAVETLEKAIKVNPDYPKSYLILAKIFENLGNFQKALELRGKALNLSPSDANDYFNLGILYGKMGDVRALDYFKKAIAIDPKFAAAHYNLAITYANLKPPKMELATKHARLALKYGYKVRPEFLKELGIESKDK